MGHCASVFFLLSLTQRPLNSPVMTIALLFGSCARNPLYVYRLDLSRLHSPTNCKETTTNSIKLRFVLQNKSDWAECPFA